MGRMSDRPTIVRWWIVAATVAMSTLLYLDRFCISFAEVYIKQDLGLSDVQVGWMLSAFFWSYALGQVPAGWLTDRCGPRLTLTAYMLAWSCLTAGTAWASGFWGLFAVRFGFGLAQAGAYPASGALLSRWIPLTSRGTASSLVALGGRLGGALAPWLTALLIVVYVPFDTPSQLVPEDVLNVADLLTDPSQPATARDRWLAATLSSETRALLRTHVETSTSSPDKQPPTGPGTADWPRLRVLVAADLNRLIQKRGTSEQAVFALDALPRQGTQLLKRDPKSLTQFQVERLNRLLLETVFAKSLRRVYTAGWRPVLLVYGALGIPVALLFWTLFRNRPSQHPWCNELEEKLIVGQSKLARKESVDPTGLPIEALLTDFSMWMNCLSQLATNVGWVFLLTWLPRYLISVHNTPIELRAWMTLIPVVAGMVGMFLGGVITDRLTARIGVRWGRALPISLSRFVAMAAYLLCLLHPGPWTAVALFSVVAFGTDLGIGSVWAYVQDVGGKQVGVVLGWGNMWGNLGAAVTPPFLIWIVGPNQNWNAAFLICAAAFFVAGIAGLGIDATRKVAGAGPQASVFGVR